ARSPDCLRFLGRVSRRLAGRRQCNLLITLRKESRQSGDSRREHARRGVSLFPILHPIGSLRPETAWRFALALWEVGGIAGSGAPFFPWIIAGKNGAGAGAFQGWEPPHALR